MLIKDICSSITDGSHNPPQGIDTSSYLMLSSKNIFDDEITLDQPRFLSKEDFENENKRTKVKCGDVLLTIVGTVGRVAVVPNNLPSFTLQRSVAVLHPDEDVCSGRYLMYALRGKRSYIESHSKGVAQKGIYLKEVSGIDLPVPSKEVQEQIIEKLDKMNSIIKSRQLELEKLDELIKARFVEMFGSPVSNPMFWKKRTLKEVCIKLNDGTHFSPESFETGEYKYVTAKNIKVTGFDFTNITYVPEEVHRPIYERCNPELGDVLYIKDGATTGIAMVNTLEEEFTLLSSVALLKQNRTIMNGYFLTALLNNEDMYMDIRNNMGGAAITRLTIAKLNAIKVIVPPIELQKQFADFVTQVNKSKVAVQKALDETQLLFDSLMQKYFG
nr:restriction endonuclease subunit S [uncultured Blautia sp.]